LTLNIEEIGRMPFADIPHMILQKPCLDFISEEELYQMFLEYCEELERTLQEAGDYRRMMFNKYPVSPVHDKYKTRFDAVAPNGREFRFEFVFTNNNHLKVYHLYETVNGRKKVTWKDIKLRTFITEGSARDDLAAHVYDVTYGSLKPCEDNLVIIDDSIVRGTTLKKSILHILDRLHPRLQYQRRFLLDPSALLFLPDWLQLLQLLVL